MDSFNRASNSFGECADAFTTSVIDAGIQRPYNGFSQLVNRIADCELLGELTLVEPPLEYPQGSPEWYAQQVGAGIGVAGDLLLARSMARGFLRNPALTAKITNPQFARTIGEGFISGATYEGVFRPIHEDEQHQFWQARLRNAMIGGTTVAALSGMNRALTGIAPPTSSLSGRVLQDAGRRALAGGTAGVVNAETFSLLTYGELVDIRTASTFGAKYALTAAVLPNSLARRFVLDPVDKTGLSQTAERGTLLQRAAESGIYDRAAPMLDEFDSRAARDGLSRQETARTYHSVSRFLESRTDTAVPRARRNELALEALFNSVHHTDVNQGDNATCIVASMEGRLYRYSPSDPIRVAAGLALNGQFRTHNGRIVRLQPDQLEPDLEARRFQPAQAALNGERPFVSQLFQLGTINAHWQRQPFRADSGVVPAGALEYRINPYGPLTPIGPSHVERLIDTRSDEAVRVDGEVVNQPMLGLTEMLRLERQITGRYEYDRILTCNPEVRRDNSIRQARNPAELRETLTLLRDSNRLPISVTVDKRQPGIAREDQAPIVMTTLRDTSGHMVKIADFNLATGDVYIDGTWGAGEDKLGHATGRKPISVQELWRIMQDGSELVRELNLSSNTEFTNSAMQRVRDWPNLTTARFARSNLNDEGLAHLRHCPRLAKLNLDYTAITSQGIAEIADHVPNLQNLSLAGTSISDEVVDHLLRMPSLTEVNIEGTGISTLAAQRLTQQNPNIRLTTGLLCNIASN